MPHSAKREISAEKYCWFCQAQSEDINKPHSLERKSKCDVEICQLRKHKIIRYSKIVSHTVRSRCTTKLLNNYSWEQLRNLKRLIICEFGVNFLLGDFIKSSKLCRFFEIANDLRICRTPKFRPNVPILQPTHWRFWRNSKICIKTPKVFRFAILRTSSQHIADFDETPSFSWNGDTNYQFVDLQPMHGCFRRSSETWPNAWSLWRCAILRT